MLRVHCTAVCGIGNSVYLSVVFDSIHNSYLRLFYPISVIWQTDLYLDLALIQKKITVRALEITSRKEIVF